MIPIPDHLRRLRTLRITSSPGRAWKLAPYKGVIAPLSFFDPQPFGVGVDRECAAQLSSVLIVRLALADSHGADHRAQDMQITP